MGYFRLRGISVEGAQRCAIHWIKENTSRLSIMGQIIIAIIICTDFFAL